MPRALVVRAEGSPFATRMARVLRTLHDEDWQCDVLCGAGAARRSDSTTSGIDLQSAVNIHEFSMPSGRWNRARQVITGAGYFGSPQMRKAIAALLASGSYDLIIVKDSPALGSVFGVLDSMGLDIPVVCEMVEPRVAQAYDSLIRYGTWATRMSAYARRILPRLRAVERVFLPRCDRIFVVCDEMKQWLIENYPLQASRISVVQNVEILSVFDGLSAAGVPPKRGIRISFVGTFGIHRGVEILIDAIGLVRKAGLAPAFTLAIVGGSNAEIRTLKRLCANAGLSDVAELETYVPHALAMQWIKETDIGVIPHLDTPGIRTTVPFKLFQYMAAGAACVVADVGPLGRIVREVNSGLSFSAGSATDLADKLTYLLTHTADARAFGIRGRRQCEQAFKWEIESRSYTEYFASVTRAAAATVEIFG